MTQGNSDNLLYFASGSSVQLSRQRGGNGGDFLLEMIARDGGDFRTLLRTPRIHSLTAQAAAAAGGGAGGRPHHLQAAPPFCACASAAAQSISLFLHLAVGPHRSKALAGALSKTLTTIRRIRNFL